MFKIASVVNNVLTVL